MLKIPIFANLYKQYDNFIEAIETNIFIKT